MKKRLMQLRVWAYDMKRKAAFLFSDKRDADLRRNYYGPAVTAMQITSVPLYLGFASMEFWVKVAENVLVKD